MIALGVEELGVKAGICLLVVWIGSVLAFKFVIACACCDKAFKGADHVK